MNPSFSNDQTEKATQNMAKAYENINDLAREHVDAAMKSASAMSRGMEEIARNANGLLQESFARSVSAGKTLMGAKDPREILNMQNEYLKDCFDCWVAGTGKISEISARMTQDVVKPMAEHANNAMSKITQKTRAAA